MAPLINVRKESKKRCMYNTCKAKILGFVGVSGLKSLSYRSIISFIFSTPDISHHLHCQPAGKQAFQDVQKKSFKMSTKKGCMGRSIAFKCKVHILAHCTSGWIDWTFPLVDDKTHNRFHLIHKLLFSVIPAKHMFKYLNLSTGCRIWLM